MTRLPPAPPAVAALWRGKSGTTARRANGQFGRARGGQGCSGTRHARSGSEENRRDAMSAEALFRCAHRLPVATAVFDALTGRGMDSSLLSMELAPGQRPEGAGPPSSL